MQITKNRKFRAAVMSAVVFCSGIDLTTMPMMPQAVVSDADALAAFSSKIREISDEYPLLADTVTFDRAHQILQCGGTNIGKQCGNFIVNAGELCVHTEEDSCLPIAEAADLFGYELYTDECGDLHVYSPFEQARLIIRASGAVDTDGAIAVAEGFHGLHVLQYGSTAEAYSAYLNFCEDASIIDVMPDRIYHICEDANSWGVPLPSWGVERIGADQFCMNLCENDDDLSEIKVALIDTGIYSNHKWFAGRIAEGGISFVDGENTAPEDGNGHGSHCAGIICSVTPENVKILPLQALSADGLGDSIGIYCAMLYAMQQGADVISMSLECTGEDPLMDEAIREIQAAGIPICVAAGNDARDVHFVSPARNPYCFCVSAIDSSGALAYYSNYGAGIDFAAPGSNICSVGIGSASATVNKNGTSMAAPFVAGCCADLLSVDPSLSASDIEAYLRANALDIGEQGFDENFGWGLVNLADFSFTREQIEPPTITVTESAEDGTVTVSLTSDDTVYYTLDNQAVTLKTGALYTEPFSPARSCILRAAAYDGERMSREVTARIRVGSTEIASPLVVQNGRLISYLGVQENADLRDEPLMAGVTEIGDGAFQYSDLKSVTLPNTVKKLGIGAFEGCGKLETVIAGGVTEIGARCFMNCTNLQTFSGVNNLRRLPSYAFYHAEKFGLNPSRLISVGDYAAAGVSVVRNSFGSLQNIGEYAFFEAVFPKNSSMVLPSVSSIGAGAFSGTNLTGLVLSSKIKRIPDEMLYNCSQLQRLDAENVTEIGRQGLALQKHIDEPNLTPVETNLPFARVTEAGDFAFEGFCFADAVSFDALENDDLAAFYHAIGSRISVPSAHKIEQLDQLTANGLTKVPIMIYADTLYLEGAETIGLGCLSGCKSVVFGDNVTDCAYDAFVFLQDAVIAGNDRSLVKYAAGRCGLPFSATPCGYVTANKMQVRQFEEAVIYGFALGFGYRGEWCTIDEYGRISESICDAAKFKICTDTVGTQRFVYQIYSSNGELTEQLLCEITVVGADVSDAEKDDFVERRILCENMPYDINSNDNTSFSFAPNHTGRYCFAVGYSQETLEDICVTGVAPRFDAHFELLDGADEVVANHTVKNTIYAILEAGQTYSVRCSVNAKNTQNLTFLAAFQKQSLSDCKMEFTETYVMGRSGQTPEIRVRNGNGKLLGEGRDYEILCGNMNELPALDVVLVGKGTYMGQISCMMQAEKKVIYNEMQLGGEYSISDTSYAYSLNLRADSKISFTSVDDISAVSLRVWDSAHDIEICNLPSIATQLLCLDKGTYLLEFYGAVSAGYNIIVCEETGQISIADASVEYESIVNYAETLDVPQFSITLADGTILQQNRDFYAEIADAENIEICGRHTAIIHGMGEYYGVKSISFIVLPHGQDIAGALVDGKNTIVIENQEDTMIYVWTPSRNHYALTAESFFGVKICVYNRFGDEICKSEGQFLSEMEIFITEYEKYYVFVEFIGHALVGSIDLYLKDGDKNLAECTIQGTEAIPYLGAEISPDFVIFDGERQLIEGVDYVLFADSETDHVGKAEFTYRGIGEYYGEIVGTTTIYEEKMDTSISEQIQVNQETYHHAEVCGEQFLLAFTNLEDTQIFDFTLETPRDAMNAYLTEYAEELPDIDPANYAFSVQVYDEYFRYIGNDEALRHFSLRYGETRYFKIIGRFLDIPMEMYSFTAKVSRYQPTAAVDGVQYRQNGAAVEILGLDENNIGCAFADKIECGDVKGTVKYDDEMLARMLENGVHIVFSLQDDELCRLCEKWGILFVPLDGVSTVAGDLNGNGIVDSKDLQILSFWLAEANGVNIPENLLRQADLSGDGVLNLVDVFLLCNLIQ